MPELIQELVLASRDTGEPVYQLLLLVVDRAAKAEVERCTELLLAEPGRRGLVFVILRGAADELLQDLGLEPLEPGDGAPLVAVLRGVEVRARITAQVMAEASA